MTTEDFQRLGSMGPADLKTALEDTRTSLGYQLASLPYGEASEILSKMRTDLSFAAAETRILHFQIGWLVAQISNENRDTFHEDIDRLLAGNRPSEEIIQFARERVSLAARTAPEPDSQYFKTLYVALMSLGYLIAGTDLTQFPTTETVGLPAEVAARVALHTDDPLLTLYRAPGVVMGSITQTVTIEAYSNAEIAAGMLAFVDGLVGRESILLFTDLENDLYRAGRNNAPDAQAFVRMLRRMS